jgi:hypothetical protein
MYDVKVKGDFIELKAMGETLDEISKVLGVSKRSLNNWNKKYENEIVSAEDNELDVLAQKLKLTKGQRLRSFSRMIEKMDRELSGRDLKEIGTQSLIALKIKTLEAVSKAMDSSKIEFGTPLVIQEDPYMEIIRQCMKADVAFFSVAELEKAIEVKKADIARHERGTLTEEESKNKALRTKMGLGLGREIKLADKRLEDAGNKEKSSGDDDGE